MSKVLVAYFSASGVTKAVAEKLAKVAKADIFEIVPAELYTAEDLDWRNKESRSTVEMQDLSCRPALKCVEAGTENYDVVFVGFPVWWGREPSVVDTFIEANDLSGKRVIPFYTSGSGRYNNREPLEKLVPGLEAEMRLNDADEEEICKWLIQLGL